MKATRAFLVCVVVGRVVYQDSAEELALLVKSDGLEPVGLLDAKRDKPDPAFFIGSGKVDELGELENGKSLNFFNKICNLLRHGMNLR